MATARTAVAEIFAPTEGIMSAARKRLLQDNGRRMEDLMRGSRESLENRANVILRDRQMAEDAVQEACLRASRTPCQYEPNKSLAGESPVGYAAWFWRVLHNVCLEWTRYGLRHPETPASSFSSRSSEGQDQPGDIVERLAGSTMDAPDLFEISGRVLTVAGECLDAWKYLTEDEQWILTKAFIEDLSPEQIARQSLSVNVTQASASLAQASASLTEDTHGSLRSRIYNARNRFRVCLQRARIDNLVAEQAREALRATAMSLRPVTAP